MDDTDTRKLIELVQLNTESNVSVNFINILKKLAEKKENSQDFVKACTALGKFNGKQEFLNDLYLKLRSQQSGGIEKNKIIERVKLKPWEKFNIDDEDEEDSINLSGKPNINKKGTSSKIKFKKIGKGTAKKLNEFSLPAKPDSGSPLITEHPKDSNFCIPTFKTFKQEVQETHIDDNVSSSGIEDDIESDIDISDTFVEDREWYDNDDDYGNIAVDDKNAADEQDFFTSNSKVNYKDGYDNLHTEIQVNTLSIEKRKDLLPPFLKQYGEKHGVSSETVAGSLLQSSNEGIASPYKNLESDFTLNAKKGSLLVAQKRAHRQNVEKNKETSSITGTRIGEVLGIKEHFENKKKKANDSNIDQTFNDISEDIQATRRSLPIYKTRNDLLRMIRENQVIIVIGETGSGKTTQLAQYLFEDGYCQNNKIVGCTQPRRVAAMSVATRVAHEIGVEVGKEVGYSIRFEDVTSECTKLKFLTDGILLRESLVDSELDRYSCIIMDEAHERSLNTDILLGIFKALLVRRRDLKLIITSATLSASKFSQFFRGAPHFKIPGRTFPVQTIYSKHTVGDYVHAAVTEAVRIHVSTDIKSGDILIFMTGQEDIEATADCIKEKLLEVFSKKRKYTEDIDENDFEIFPIYSALPSDIQNRIFQDLHGIKRKIVISTNIAETSLTIDGIRYVIDSGYSKIKVYNPKIGLDSLVMAPISIASSNQRSGRAGRTAPGTAYRLYTEETMREDMYTQTIPEIQRTNLSNTLLLLKSLNITDVFNFSFLDPPPIQTLLASMYELWFIGAIDNSGNLSSLGKTMSKFPLPPSLSKILLISSKNGCSQEMLIIVSMLSVPNIFNRPKEQQQESDTARSRFFVPESDHLTLLNVFSQWKSNRYSHLWCTKHFLNYRSLKRANDIRIQLSKVMKKLDIPLTSSGSDWDVIRKCICSGFSHQAAKLSGLGKYIHLKTGMDVHLHPTSALFGLGDLPPYVVYHELLMTNKEYISCVTAVDPFWLVDFGPFLYDLKRIGSSSNAGHKLYGYDTEEEDSGEVDELDLRIKSVVAKRDTLINNIKKLVEEQPITTNQISNVNTKRMQTQSNVHVGFKKRRPL
ncbi:hypothetical protein Kpol_1018p85 [Vanderwaltozyma polyspora DSM 70294]|uniref:RNA helicase n=1 Tax=Vanderwaltozyma polyspora (strain ATCC 22028 / DSM 70294 / BCRC 21397 / CBS 2163 / NBRC 10782 / NRRL Y-8283 / UCD 57-17) TaxID=436907 RepID=A7TDT2_VANPO|nr:uncharacterized protein Kpol_1018p85 [Vanderwaltozyma polyspora DSM 70294]EDO19552.1 hypothetical protein Kpol_1018p85 [Vanderwaltozyma polyspora DSM 70294]